MKQPSIVDSIDFYQASILSKTIEGRIYHYILLGGTGDDGFVLKFSKQQWKFGAVSTKYRDQNN